MTTPNPPIFINLESLEKRTPGPIRMACGNEISDETMIEKKRHISITRDTTCQDMVIADDFIELDRKIARYYIDHPTTSFRTRLIRSTRHYIPPRATCEAVMSRTVMGVFSRNIDELRERVRKPFMEILESYGGSHLKHDFRSSLAEVLDIDEREIHDMIHRTVIEFRCAPPDLIHEVLIDFICQRISEMHDEG